MEFLKNDYIDKINERTYQSFAVMLDTDQFVESKYNKKIAKSIYKNMRQKYGKINAYYLLELEDMGLKLNIFQRLYIAFSNVRPIYEVEKAERQKQEREKTARKELVEKLKAQAKKKKDKK